MRPKLSVVVPYYNVQAYIADCLRSIQRQSLRNIEVILVDDGSTDDSVEAAKEFVASDSRFRLVTQPNAGLGPARNTGLTHATGDFITFVDSDDLVSRFGFERMIASMEWSGSPIAAGNTLRFNSSNVHQSWTHRGLFTGLRTGTHIFDFRGLVRDRMVWNKVYDRRFFTDHGYEFPAIRYEDYPVTLPAHVQAASVDLIPDVVYYWRERESGDSITQQVFAYDNLSDRVVSAEMVLEWLSEHASWLVPATTRNLFESDFVAIASSFASVPDDQADALLNLGRRLMQRFDDRQIGERHHFEQLQARAIRRGDVELLRELARFRIEGGLRDGARARTNPQRPWRLRFDYPGQDRRYLPRTLFDVPRSSVTLRTRTSEVFWTAEGLRVRGAVEIRHIPTTEKSRLRIHAINSKSRQRLPVYRFAAVDSHGETNLVGIDVLIPEELIRRWSLEHGAIRLEATLTSAGYTRTDRLRGIGPGSPSWGIPRRYGTVVAQPGSERGDFAINWRRNPWALVHAEVIGDRLRLEATSPVHLAHARFRVAGSYAFAEVSAEAELDLKRGETRLTAEIPVADLVAGEHSDGPLTQVKIRKVEVAWRPAQPGNARPSVTTLPWELPDASLTLPVEGRTLRLTRSSGGLTNLVESPPMLYADFVEVRHHDGGPLLYVSGPWDGAGEPDLTWRRPVRASDELTSVRSSTSVADGRWQVVVDLADLDRRSPSRNPTSPVLSDWHLYFRTAESAGWEAVLVDPFLATDLPLEHELGAHVATVVPHQNLLRPMGAVMLELRAAAASVDADAAGEHAPSQSVGGREASDEDAGDQVAGDQVAGE